MKSGKFISLAALAAILSLTLLGLTGGPAAAAPEATIKPTTQIAVPPAQVRTAKQMAAAAALRPAGPPPASRKKPFHTRMGAAAYQELKGKAPLSPGRRAAAAPQGATQSAVTQAAITNPVNFDGVDEATAIFYPPDTHGAVGLNHFAEVTNDHIDIYLKTAPNNRVISIDTESWMSPPPPALPVTPGSFTDPRMIYDPVNSRWIFLVAQFRATGSTQQFLYLAVSLTSDPTGDFYIYQIDVNDASAGTDTFWDFPQLGMDGNAIIVTGDLYHFDTGVYIDSRMFPVGKSLLYSGQAFTLQLFTPLVGPLAPPIVLDDNPNTYLVAADYFTSNTTVTLYTLTNSAAPIPDLSDSGSITLPTAFFMPPSAIQPGTAAVIDTMDARFLNASTQIGNSLFQVHSIADGLSLVSPRFYEFDTVHKQVIQTGTFFASASSYDFNASIAANRHKDVFVTWSSTDPAKPDGYPEVRYSGRLHTDPLGVIPRGDRLCVSATALTGNEDPPGSGFQRWGDYSAVSLDPADPSGATAWIVNEYILATDNWGSRIGRIRLPLRNTTPVINSLLLLD